MKKILTVFLAMTAFTSLFACWFSQTNINNAYIAGVNFFKPHYEEVILNDTTRATNSNDREWAKNLQFTNNIFVSLPLTVWFKVSPRKYFINGKQKSANIRISKLYYKIIPLIDDGTNKTYNYFNPDYKWRLAKSVDMTGKPWRLNFSAPVKIFGNNTLTLKQIIANGDSIKEGDKIILVWYIADDSNEALENVSEIKENQSEPYIKVDENTCTGDTIFGDESDGYDAPYVMSVIYNGKKTLGR